MQKGYLILQNGQVFEGERCGETESEPVGEVVFTTGMAGYQQTLCDPAYYGQMVVQTFPLIGNAGALPADSEDDTPKLSAYITHSLCEAPSNFRSTGRLEAWLKGQGVPAFCMPETRMLTRMLRQDGVMNGALCHSPEPDDTVLAALRGYRVQGAVEATACAKSHTLPPAAGTHTPVRVVLWDFGAKQGIPAALQARGAEVVVMPPTAPFAEILAAQPRGIVLTGGPGDPADNPAAVRFLRQLYDTKLPILGVGLGHQLMALAAGGRCRKMKYGHRGANQPVQNTETGRVAITSQNHGYCVIAESLPAHACVLYKNANDGTCEGVRYGAFPGLSVQFLPEAGGGPGGTDALYDEFMALAKEVGGNA